MAVYGVARGIFSSFVIFFDFNSRFLNTSVSVFVSVQTQWMVAQQTVMGMESVWLDTATASLDSWVLTVPKVRDI